MSQFKPDTCETCISLYSSLRPCADCLQSPFKRGAEGRVNKWRATEWFTEVARLTAELKRPEARSSVEIDSDAVIIDQRTQIERLTARNDDLEAQLDMHDLRIPVEKLIVDGLHAVLDIYGTGRGSKLADKMADRIKQIVDDVGKLKDATPPANEKGAVGDQSAARALEAENAQYTGEGNLRVVPYEKPAAPAPQPDPFVCLECGEEFDTRAAWRTHLTNRHEVEPDEPAPAAPITPLAKAGEPGVAHTPASPAHQPGQVPRKGIR